MLTKRIYDKTVQSKEYDVGELINMIVGSPHQYLEIVDVIDDNLLWGKILHDVKNKFEEFRENS